MIHIVFVCHGNICRSPMAEFLFRDMVEKRGLSGSFSIGSAAVSAEALGRPVHPGARAKLLERGISCEGKQAVQLHWKDYSAYDYFIGMDRWNIQEMERILRGDPEGKIRLLLNFTDRPADIADPWYTGDFDATYQDIQEGCEGLLEYFLSRYPSLKEKP